ncbi:hypothetical protein V5799_006504 [Amblyomma americanum]|uniref:Hexosyltransferase n=1 Tax=Amblyomma americanum TaxID=6943 RepID=A0AAQ4DW75_AMBAM
MSRLDTLRREISKHGDLLVAPYLSTANNSVEITLDMMRWVEGRCGKGRPLRLFVHVNDTVFADPVTLEHYSSGMNKNGRPSFYCKVVKGVDVGRDPQGVNFVPHDLFRGPVFPPYCEGDAFFMNGTHLGQLYAASLYALHYALVPQYVTGHMAVIADIRHENIDKQMDVARSLGGSTKSRENASLRPKLFLTGIEKNMWKDVWLYSLYNQTRDSQLEKDLIDDILGRLASSLR